jgi:drug/metabolite transporter (DMT)-like permease
MTKKLAYIYIILAAILWGIIGLFVTNLYKLGFSAMQIVAIRAITACLFLVTYALIKNRKLLLIKTSYIKYFVGTGIISFVLFNLCLFNAIKETSISIATILLYTAPAFVTLLSWIFFKEILTIRKISALSITSIGSALVVGVASSSDSEISLIGLALGVGSGFFYALYSIFGKYALVNSNSITVTIYTFVFASLAILPFIDFEILSLISSFEAWINVLGIGFFSTVLAFTLYTKGLETIESSRASIIATIEPVVASIISFIVFNEKLSTTQYIGIILVITAVLLVQESTKKNLSKVTNESHAS